MFGVLAVTVYLESGVVAASATQKGFRIFGLAFTFTVLAYCRFQGSWDLVFGLVRGLSDSIGSRASGCWFGVG